MNKIAIKIIPDNKLNKYLVPLRKYTILSISEILNKIENREVFVETDANDIDELERLKELVNNLINLGGKVKIIYRRGNDQYQEISQKEFYNTINHLKEIAEQLQDYDDAVSEE
ncbi:hypothetical protein PJ311_08155 [Bacillus sp. CLL-7-23]|uniref:Uncharacterized protein n=1 Tax=Bacillus changyiensis TaxID=3004103 RepID=A0ABT4X2Q1_9BACI|nr:hypothetical protein [Bacillus changyiensis]MDA7026582.1 hypothetical protein [Bacillus changyiensis]